MTDITLHKIGGRDRKIPILKLVEEPGKIGQTAWQNRSDVTKIGSTTVRVNEGLGITIQYRERANMHRQGSTTACNVCRGIG
jgi:hypothetical protein